MNIIEASTYSDDRKTELVLVQMRIGDWRVIVVEAFSDEETFGDYEPLFQTCHFKLARDFYARIAPMWFISISTGEDWDWLTP